MRRLRKSAKALIISLVSVVCVATIVLGCVFGLRDGGNKPNLPPANAFDLLGAEINSSIEKPEYEIFEGCPYEGVALAGENGENVRILRSNYFILEDAMGNEHFYTFRKKLTGSGYDVKELTARESDGGFVDNEAISYDIFAYNDQFIVMANQFSLEEDLNFAYNKTFNILNFSDFENIISIYEISTINTNLIVGSFILNENFCFIEIFENYQFSEEIDENNFEYDIHSYAIPLNGLIINEDEICRYDINVNSDNFDEQYSRVENTFLAYTNNGSLIIYEYENGKFNKFSIAIDGKVVGSIVHIAKNKFFVEYISESSLDNKKAIINSDGKTIVYSYSIVTLENEKLISYDYLLNEGFSKAKAFFVGDNKLFYYVYEQKSNINHELINAFVNKYFDENGKLVLSYTGDIEEDRLNYYKSSFFITNNKIFKINENNSLYTIFDKNINNIEFKYNDNYFETIVIVKNGLYGLLNYDGKYIIDPENSSYVSMSKIVNGYVIAETLDNYEKINVVTGESFVLDDYENNSIFSILLNMGYDLYFTNDLNSSCFSIKNLKGDILINNFSEISALENLDLGASLIFNNDEDNYDIKLLNLISDFAIKITPIVDSDDVQNNDYINSIEPFIDRTPHNLVDGNKVIGTVTHLDNDWHSNIMNDDWYEIIMEPGYMLNGYAFHANRTDRNHWRKIYINTTISGNNDTVSCTINVENASDGRTKYSCSVEFVEEEGKTYLKYSVWMYTYYPVGQGGGDIYDSTVGGNWSSIDTYAYFIVNEDISQYGISINQIRYREKVLDSENYYDKIDYELQGHNIIGARVTSWRTHVKDAFTRSRPKSYFSKYLSIGDPDYFAHIGEPGDYITLETSVHLAIYYWAYYEPNVYSVKLKPEGGEFKTTEDKFIYLKYNDGLYEDFECSSLITTSTAANANNVEVPTRFGYTFLGFYTQSGTQIINASGYYTGNSLTFCSNEYDYTNHTAGGTELIAKWNINRYSLQFNLGSVDNGNLVGFDSSDLNFNNTTTLKNNVGNSALFTINDRPITSSELIHTYGYKVNRTYKYFISNRQVLPYPIDPYKGYSEYYDYSEWIRGNDSKLYSVFDYSVSQTIFELLALGSNENDIVVKNIGPSSIISVTNNAIRYNGSVYCYEGDEFLYSQQGASCEWYKEGYANLDYKNNPTISVIESSYIFDGWAYKDGDNLVHIDNNTTISDILKAEFAGTGDNGILTLYATFIEKSYYINGENSMAGGSVEIDGSVDDINYSDVKAQINWNVNYSVNGGSNNYLKTPNSFEAGSLAFEYNKFSGTIDGNTTPKGGSDIAITLSVNTNFDHQMYRLRQIVLENFAYCSSANGTPTFEIVNLIFSYDGSRWKITGPGVSEFISTNKKYTFGVIYPSSSNTYNYIIFDDVTSAYSISFRVCNCMIGTTLDPRNPNGDNKASQAGQYGFNCVAYAESNYTENDSTISSGIGNGNINLMNVVDLSTVNGVWINGLYFNKSSFNTDGGYALDGNTLRLDTNYDIYKDGNYLYYTNKVNMNFNSTQLIAIRPDQKNIVYSATTMGSTKSSNSVYELNKYLSGISINGTRVLNSDQLKLNREVSGGSVWQYNTLTFNGGNKFSNNKFTINYYGANYSIADGVSFNYEGRTFVLYIARNVVNNEIMYFLYSDMNNNVPITLSGVVSNGNVRIEFTFNDFNYQIQVNTNFENSDSYNNSDKAVVNIITQTTANSVNNNVISNVKPSDLYTLSVAPKDGYLIRKITFSLKNGNNLVQEIFSASLLGYELRYDGNPNVYHFMSTSGTTITSGITYDATGSSFVGAGGLINSNNGYFGINYAMWTGANLGNTIDGFETLFFIVGGIYHNLIIDVELISYAEFDFQFDGTNNNNSLKLETGNKGSASLGNLTIAYANGNNWIKVENSEVEIKQLSTNIYRVIFLGNAAKLKNGYKIYATGENYSFAFKDGRYYEKGDTVSLVTNGFNGNKLLVSKGNFTFSGTTGDSVKVSAQKFLLGVTVVNYSNSISSTAYLGNQIDNTKKANSWFNDTVLTNIDYLYFASQHSSSSKLNWQSNTSNGFIYNYGENPIISANYGFGITFTYYEIPGYYLSKISVNNFELNINSYLNQSNKSVVIGNIKYFVDYKNSYGKFEIKFYSGLNQVNDETTAINTLLNGLDVKFYSSPYNVQINYQSNYGNASTLGTYNIGANTQQFAYDSMTTLLENPTMKGYTFVGWGSEKYNGIIRQNNLVWNSSSRWVNPSNLFAPGNRNSLLACKEISFNRNNSEYYDFYVKGGYFITDYGYVNQTGQNYNFWLANAKAFSSTINNYNAGGTIQINLYAIWKANTYRINLNLNDYGVADSANNLTRGSTNAFLSKGNSLFARPSVGSVINAGNLNVDSNIYYAYVTFDKDDWYITTNNYGYDKSNQSGNMLDIIVDRYGYSWLGFTSKEQRYVTGDSGAPTNENMVFASNFNKANQVDFTFNDTLYRKFNVSELNVSDLQFYYKNQYSISAYSNLNLNENSVVFYQYAATGSIAKDYLNNYIFANNNLACFDTSLAYSAYQYQPGQLTYNTRSYRGITLYAYWQANKYIFNIDFRDSEGYSNNKLGTSPVTNTSFVTNKINEINCYFDDAVFANYINQAVPVRVGYDFVGWAFRFDSEAQDAYSQSKAFLSDNYLNNSLLSSYSAVNNVLTTGNYNNAETFGDLEGENHVVYIFAIWRTQKFTINFSLNISGQNLKNLYDQDSNFAVALYNSSRFGYDGTYSGIEQNYFKNNTANIGREYVFNDIISNIVFTATFDDEIGNSYFEFGGKTYYLKDLFASSAGYYFIGWIYDALDQSTNIVLNNLKTIFTESGNLQNNFASGGTNVDGSRTKFNYTMYGNLFNSDYKLSQDNFLNGNNIKLTMIDGSGVSTNFGYVIIDGKNYYIVHEYYEEAAGITRGRLYYIKDGVKHYVSIGTRNSDGTINEFTFTDAFMYYENTSYIIRFADGVAYYIDNDGVKHDVQLRCAEVSATGDYITGVADNSFVATTTRQFTLYANWQIRDDLEIKISNGNNGDGKPVENQTGESNNGLAGHYHISNATTSNGSTTAAGIEVEGTTAGYIEEFIILGFSYYNNLKFDIIPYFNGRYLSELKMTYHAVEWVEGVYVRVPYTLTIKFTWRNSENIMTIANVSSISVSRFGVPIGSYELETTKNAQGGYTQTITNSDGSGKLSMLDRKLLEKFGFVVNAYADDYSESALANTYNRRDVNKVDFDFERVSSDIEIVCKFSIQTFEVDIYNLFDDNGNTLKQRENSNVYDTGYLDDLTFQQAVDSSSSGSFAPLISSSPTNYNWTNAGGNLVRLATISTDVASSVATSYNVPYGYFMYGVYYNSDTQKPTDKIEDGVLVNINQQYNGYEYIYSNGYYNAGTTDVKLQTVNNDSHFSQCSPLLGSTGAFPDQSIILNLTIYTFFHWFEYTPDNNGAVVFTEYAEENGESKYVNRNIKLYGYYYTENKPTSVEFYTWDKDKYVYTEIDSGNTYVLNDNSTSSPFKIENGIIQTIESRADYVDENGFARVKTYNEYGVNQVKFNSDNFKIDELNTAIDMTFINKLLRTYWYMQESYDVLYFMLDGEKYYIKFNASGQYFYYESKAGTEIKIPSINSGDMEFFTAEIDGNIISLQTERHYVYDVTGSKMYVKITKNGNDRYYELKTVTAEENARYYAGAGAVPSFITNAEPRYYVDIESQRYYMMLRNKTDNISADTLYNDAGGFALAGTSYTIENIDEYYVKCDDNYTKINYELLGDGYINPYQGINSSTLFVENEDGNVVEVTFLFDYERKQLTQSGINQIYFEYELYTAVNDNYSASFSLGLDRWEITGITISRLPSPNSGFWYHDSTYGFVSFIKFTTTDLEQLKQKDENKFDTDQQRIYAVFVDYINNRRHEKLADVSDYALEDLKNVVSNKISEYTMRNVLNNLIGVSEFVYDNGVIKQVIANIPISFNGLVFKLDEEGTQTREIDITVTVKYLFEVVRPNQTKIDDNVYAIPIYSPYIMQFNKSATKSGTTVTIDTEEARVSHFEVGSSVHIYNDDTDPINFVVLNAEQYAAWTVSSDLPDGRLTNMLANGEYETDFGIRSNYGLASGSKKINLNFAGKTGEYYVVMFYYKYDSNIPIGSRTQVARVSDDILKITASGASCEIKVVDRGYTD